MSELQRSDVTVTYHTELSMKQVVKELLRDFFSNTTLHGLSNMMNKGTPLLRRTLWLVVIILVNVGFGVVMVFYIISYLKYEYVISVKMNQHNRQQFPAITACNINLYSKRKVEETTPIMIDYLDAFFSDVSDEEFIRASNYTQEQFDNELNLNFYSFMLNTTYTAEEFFVSCRPVFRSAAVNCTPYVTSFFGDAGLCYTFHSKQYVEENGAIYKTHNGLNNALIITYNVNVDDYMYSFLTGKGMLIDVHHVDDEPYMDNNALMITPGTSTVLALQKVL